MKKITLQKGGKGKIVILIAVASIVALVLAVCGISIALNRLNGICERQCCLTDAGEQERLFRIGTKQHGTVMLQGPFFFRKMKFHQETPFAS